MQLQFTTTHTSGRFVLQGNDPEIYEWNVQQTDEPLRARPGNGGEEEPFSRIRRGEGQVSMWSQCIMGNPQQHINEVAWDHPIHPLMKPVIGPTYGWAEIWRFILIFSSIFEPSQLLKHRGHVSIAGKQCFSCSTSFLLKIRAVILRLRAEQWEFGFKLWHLEWV